MTGTCVLVCHHLGLSGMTLTVRCSAGSASVCSGIALLDSGSLVCGVMDLLVLVFIL